MKNLTIGRRITIGFACTILCALALGLFAYAQLHSISVAAAQITSNKSLPALYSVGRMESLAHEIGTLSLKNLLTHNEELKNGFEAKIHAGLDQLVVLE